MNKVGKLNLELNLQLERVGNIAQCQGVREVLLQGPSIGARTAHFV